MGGGNVSMPALTVRARLLGFGQSAASIAAWAGILISTAFWTILIFFAYVPHEFLDPQRRLAHRLASLWGRTLIRMAPGSRVEVIGWKNVPQGRPVIFMANHQSYVDVPFLFFLRTQFKWMADEGLFKIPVFGWAMRMAGYIPVRRGDPRRGMESLAQAKAYLQEGISIFIFPEGTRSHTGVFGRFQTGGFRLAMSMGMPIVPVVVSGTRQLLPRGSWAFRWGIRLKVRILPPVPIPRDSRYSHELIQRVRPEMKKAFQEALLDERHVRIKNHGKP